MVSRNFLMTFEQDLPNNEILYTKYNQFIVNGKQFPVPSTL